MQSSPTSLDALVDIVVPPPAPWWPLAPGWWLVGGLLIATLLWRAVIVWNRWRRNAYRRAALREVDRIVAAAMLLWFRPGWFISWDGGGR